MQIFFLDGRLMTSREKAYDHIEEVMRMPEWFGHNLDALADCLSEFSSETLVVLLYTDQFLEELGDYGEKMLNCFREQTGEPGALTFIEK